jgi:uncharacterized protein (TIGR02597 family)
MMKTPTKFIALLSGAALLASSAFAQGVATNPVGYVTVEAKNGSDTYVGLTLTKASDLTTSVASVSGLDINVTESVAGSFAFTHYVLFSSGSQAGQWFEVTANDAGSLTLSGGEGVTDLGVDLGILADDAFKVIGFWEVNQVFPDGVGFAASADVFGPTSLIFINNLEAAGTNLSAAGSYFYHDGSSGFKAAGWYENGTLTAADSIVIPAGAAFVVRKAAGAVALAAWNPPAPYSL